MKQLDEVQEELLRNTLNKIVPEIAKRGRGSQNDVWQAIEESAVNNVKH